VQVEIHRGPPAALRDVWDELLAADVDATPFASPEWHSAWWQVWGDSVEPWLAVVHDGNDVCALAPLALTRHGPMRALRPLTGDHGGHWDIVARPATRPEAYTALAHALARHRTDWDTLILRGLPPTSPLGGALQAEGLRVRTPPLQPCPGLELPQTFDEYLALLPRNRRENLRRHLRRLDGGTVSLHEIRGNQELGETITAGHALRVRQWAERGKTLYGLHRTSEFRDFLVAAARLLVPKGRMLVWEMRQGEALAGVHLNLVDDHTFYVYIPAFDPAFARLGIGKIATAFGIRASIEAGRRMFDFGTGGDAYKYFFGARDIGTASIIASGRSVRSRAAFAAAGGARRLRDGRDAL
jgi:CelD/BcsL family acetyltransferase involved in cellulose biosynthesis